MSHSALQIPESDFLIRCGNTPPARETALVNLLAATNDLPVSITYLTPATADFVVSVAPAVDH